MAGCPDRASWSRDKKWHARDLAVWSTTCYYASEGRLQDGEGGRERRSERETTGSPRQQRLKRTTMWREVDLGDDKMESMGKDWS